MRHKIDDELKSREKKREEERGRMVCHTKGAGDNHVSTLQADTEMKGH